MRFDHLLAFTFVASPLSCQSALLPTVTIIDNDQILTLQTNERIPSVLLTQAGIILNPNDRILLNGLPISVDQPITTYAIILQTRRAIPITIITPDGKHQIQSAAFPVSETIQESSIWLRACDKIEPSLTSPISNSLISISPTSDLIVTSIETTFQTHSSAQTVGEALAEAGVPLIGLDYGVPTENEPLPNDGKIGVVRVTESLQLVQKPIPFESELQASADVPLDQTQILQPGEPPLTVQRLRIRDEDGEEISRLTEDETIVRPPKKRILAYGTKIEVKTAMVDGVNLE